jgi:uncharacterized delta-60 repeat protein
VPSNEVGTSLSGGLTLQPDGRILIFGSVGIGDSFLQRLNADGTIDASFNCSVCVSMSVGSAVVQPDGKVLIGGFFNGINGFNRTNLIRVNADGTLDASFNAGSIGEVEQIELQADGKYVVLTIYDAIIRLNNNGAADNSFQSPTFTSPSGNLTIVNSILVEADNSIVVGGSFTGVNNIARLRIARLRPDGRVDLSFLPTGANKPVFTLLRQPDAKILVGGEFSVIGNTVRYGIAQLISSPFRNITPFDFDGDGRADFTVFRPSSSYWYILNSSNNSFLPVPFGAAGDLIAPADYDGDGRADAALFRPTGTGDPNKAYFYIQQSRANSLRAEQFGRQGDVPVSGDWDGDGRADIAVFRPENGNWYVLRSTSGFFGVQWGTANDKPAPAAYVP